MFRDWFRWRHESEAVGMKQNLPGGNSAVVPPDPMPNSEVKRRSADGSVGSPHARVGHCQASIKPRGHPQGWPFCYGSKTEMPLTPALSQSTRREQPEHPSEGEGAVRRRG